MATGKDHEAMPQSSPCDAKTEKAERNHGATPKIWRVNVHHDKKRKDMRNETAKVDAKPVHNRHEV